MATENLKLKIENSASEKPGLLLHACCAPCSTSVYERLCERFNLTVFWYNPNIFPAVEHDKRLEEIKKLAGILGFELVIDENSRNDHEKWLNYSPSVIPASPSVIPASPSVIPASPSVIPAKAGICQSLPNSLTGNIMMFTATKDPRVKPEDDKQKGNNGSSTIRDLSEAPESGVRCQFCYRFRMERAYQYAVEHGFDYFSTTLTVSPHKNAPKILEIGRSLPQMDNRHTDKQTTDIASSNPPFKMEGDVSRPSSLCGVKFLDENFRKNNGYLRSIELSKQCDLYRQDYCGCEFSMR